MSWIPPAGCTSTLHVRTHVSLLLYFSYSLFRFILRNSSDVSTGTTYYQLPAECPSNNEASGHSRPCTGSNFIPHAGQGCTVYTNHQELRVQEQMQCLEPGSVPASIVVTVQDELADCCQPGGAPNLHAEHIQGSKRANFEVWGSVAAACRGTSRQALYRDTIGAAGGGAGCGCREMPCCLHTCGHACR